MSRVRGRLACLDTCLVGWALWYVSSCVGELGDAEKMVGWGTWEGERHLE